MCTRAITRPQYTAVRFMGCAVSMVSFRCGAWHGPVAQFVWTIYARIV